MPAFLYTLQFAFSKTLILPDCLNSLLNICISVLRLSWAVGLFYLKCYVLVFSTKEQHLSLFKAKFKQVSLLLKVSIHFPLLPFTWNNPDKIWKSTLLHTALLIAVSPIFLSCPSNTPLPLTGLFLKTINKIYNT